VSFDDHFETTRKGVEVLLPWLNWQECAHFTTAEKVPQLQPISPEVSGLRESDQQEKSSSNQKQSWKFFRRLRNLRWLKIQQVWPLVRRLIQRLIKSRFLRKSANNNPGGADWWYDDEIWQNYSTHMVD
jgi:hypothetical protein